jgi:hypothetical protein
MTASGGPPGGASTSGPAGNASSTGTKANAFASRVRAQVFPLAADRRTLQRFCDMWFNACIPREVAVFRPAMPFVFCMVIAYDDIGSDFQWRTGAMSQNEVHFMLVLDRYRDRSGRLEFVEHAAATPYIFVDNPTSAVIGRERFGFPKQLCSYHDPGLPFAVPWPSEPEPYVSLWTWEPGTTGRRLEPLVQIVREPRAGAIGVLDTRRGNIAAPRSLVPSTDDLLRWVQTLLAEVVARTSPGPLGEVPGQIEELRYTIEHGLGLSVYNLRQFPDPFYEDGAHYQDLVRCRMRPRVVPAPHLLSGDFAVLIDRTDTCPIVDRLGLTVAARQQSARRTDGRTIDVLRAISPIYMQLDVELDEANRLCWRNLQGGWRGDDGSPIGPTGDVARYNDYLGPSSAVFLEPENPKSVLDVKFLLLAARADSARAFIRGLVPPGSHVSLEALTVGPYTPVRVLVSRSRPKPASDEEVVWLDGNYVSISIPVNYVAKDGGGTANLMLYEFTDNEFLLQCLRALNPGTASQAAFAARGDWFSDMQPLSTVLQIDAMTLRRRETAWLEMGRLLEVFAVGRHYAGPAQPADPELSALRDAMWPWIRTIKPFLSIGAIPSVDDPDVCIEQQITLTNVTTTTVEDLADPPQPYCIQFHPSELCPLDKLDLVPVRDPLLRDEVQRGLRDQTEVLAVLGYAETSLRVTFEEMSMLWSSRTAGGNSV